MNDLAAELRETGWTRVEATNADEPTLEIARRLGSISAISGIAQVQELIPRSLDQSSANSYGGIYGLEPFPLHTDMAHWFVPPHFILLRCVRPAPEVFTLALHFQNLFDDEEATTVRRALFRPRRRIDGRLTSLHLHDRGICRWDPIFITPITKSAADLRERIHRRIDGATARSFPREHANFCASHFARRNNEVHTLSFPFENVGSSTWLPTFYAVCEILLNSFGESLESLFGSDTAAQVREDIDALRDETAKSVKGTINAHKTVWEQKSDEERTIAIAQAQTASLRHYGHRVDCPSCGSIALLQGKAAGEAKRTVDDDGIHERQVMKPEAFSCVACGLKIMGFSKLLGAGLGNTYISTSHYDAVEFFDIDIEERARNMMEDDNNEY